jgi:hypothetical protein
VVFIKIPYTNMIRIITKFEEVFVLQKGHNLIHPCVPLSSPMQA